MASRTQIGICDLKIHKVKRREVVQHNKHSLDEKQSENVALQNHVDKDTVRNIVDINDFIHCWKPEDKREL